MLPEERAREKIDRQLKKAGWDIVSREEYIPHSASAVKEALMQGNAESDYLLFVDDKAIAVVEAKREENPLAEDVQSQAEGYATHPQNWYGLWYDGLIPLVYLANGSKIYFKNLLSPETDYIELAEIHSPKKMLQLIHQVSAYGALPRLEKRGLRDCQYRAEMEFENAIKNGKKKSLAVLATGSGKTYLACLASYRLLNYTPVRRILFLVDRNNLARQTESEFSQFDRTEGQAEMNSLYEIKRLRHDQDVKADIVISTIQKLFAVLTGQQLSEDSEDAEDERTTQEEEKEGKDFVQKITYTSGDSNGLIRDLRIEKDFRIAVTVTLVATGTDVKPLEVVLFMKDVMSDVLYTQMKGRGCRVVDDEKLREVTPNAGTKECYPSITQGTKECRSRLLRRQDPCSKVVRRFFFKRELIATGIATNCNFIAIRLQ